MLQSKNSLFRNIAPIRFVELESMIKPFWGKAGEELYRDGESEVGLYFIEEGVVEIHHSSLERETIPELRAIRGPGEYFGEMAMIDRRRRHIVVKICEEVRGHYLPGRSFETFIEKEPHLLINLTRDVLQRNTEHDSELIRELIRTKTSAERYIRNLKIFSENSRRINSTIELKKLLKIILSEAIKVTECDSGTIYLVDEKEKQLCSTATDGDRTYDIVLPLGIGIAGTVAENGIPINIKDAYTDTRFNSDIDKVTGYKTKSMLTLPMRNHHDVIVGVIQLINKTVGVFNIDDEHILSVIGTQASIAIEKARLAEAMAKEESLSAVGRLASGIIHDFKNPMTVIRGYTQMITLAKDGETRQKYVDIILKHVDRMTSMTKEVLDFSRGELSIDKMKCNIFPFIDDICCHLNEDFQEDNVEVLNETVGEDFEAEFDSEKLTRVLHNLAGNSRDAIEDEGKVVFRAFRDPESWTIEVEDDGGGIDEAFIQKIFEPFATHGKDHGTGLGLSIVKQVIEAHGGKISVESELKVGTKFILNFPF
jgi:signal transduction histidine kinase/CRP-like cAMP-binding protein